MSEIIQVIGERETQKKKAKQNKIQKKKKKTKAEKNKGYGSYSERVRAKWFCCAFKLAL